ncbi:MAG: RNA polymerase sigma-70 factor (ECF subfamily) [Lentimonas sp.]|jgi:RNA polymerase sigma-70 factor (ECF subfamily)
MEQNPNNNFEAIVSTYYQSLYRFGYSLAKNEHDAGDLAQQTFFIYAEKGHSLRDQNKVKSWLFTTLYREFLRRRNKDSRLAHYDPELLENTGSTVEPNVQRATDGNLAIEALDEVDAVYREPLALFYLKDLSYKEIADVLDVPIGTVMSRLSRGKTQLRKLFKRKETERFENPSSQP